MSSSTLISPDSLLTNPGNLVIHCFERGPIFREIAQLIAQKVEVPVVLAKIRHADNEREYNYPITLTLFDSVPVLSCGRVLILYKAHIVDGWVFSFPGAFDRYIEGYLDNRRLGIFIFPIPSHVHLL